MLMRSPRCSLPHRAFAALALATGVACQCTNFWLPGMGVPGVEGRVDTMLPWDPDGAGPATPVLVVGGAFTAAGDKLTNGIATWDPVNGQWAALGSGLVFGEVSALLALPNGELLVGGEFRTAGAVAANNIARWNGTTWSQVGGALAPAAYSLAAMPNGDIVAGGSFASAGGVAASGLARWNGVAWSQLGGGVASPFARFVNALAVMPNGDLIVGGQFSTAGGLPTNGIARWNGSSWSQLGSGLQLFDSVEALVVLPTGDLMVGGQFTLTSGAASNLARWDGTAWSPLGSGVDGTVHALALARNGDLLAAGFFGQAGGIAAPGLARWTGATWLPFGSGVGNGQAYAVAALPSGAVVAGGTFRSAGGLLVTSIARWDGVGWAALSGGTDAGVFTLLTLATGEVIAGGSFTTIEGVPANRIARWDGNTWSPLGTGISGGPTPRVLALSQLTNGDLVAAGRFQFAGSASANNIARWDGQSWSALGSGLSSGGNALARLPNGDLIAGGTWGGAGGFSGTLLGRWDGSNWSPAGLPLVPVAPVSIHALLTRPNGDLVVGGQFGSTVGFHLAVWDGTAWSDLGANLDGPVTGLATMANGDLVVAGGFSTAGGTPAARVARWNGSSWSALGAGLPGNSPATRTPMVLPDGDLLVAVTPGTVAAASLQRWDGANWSAVAGVAGVNLAPRALAPAPDGSVLVAGTAVVAGNAASVHLSRFATTCLATAVPQGAGCVGSGGLNVLTSIARPWLASTYRAKASGLPSHALALQVQGLATASLALSALAPFGTPGCSLYVRPDLLMTLAPSAGSADVAFLIPNAAALVGQVVHQQAVALDLTALGSIAAMTSTNALQLTIGAW
jgi:trimeric autotransporter adhesin